MTDVLEPTGVSENETDQTDEYTALVGENVTVRDVYGRTSHGVLIGQGRRLPGAPPADDDGATNQRRGIIMLLHPNGNRTLDETLRNQNLSSYLQLPLADIVRVMREHHYWQLGLIEAERVMGRAPRPQLRVMDGIYLVSRVNVADGEGGEVPMPEGERSLDRVGLVLRQDGDAVLTYFPATGEIYQVAMSHTKFHRLFRATSASWCSERVTVIEQVAEYMRREWVEAREEDGEDPETSPETVDDE